MAKAQEGRRLRAAVDTLQLALQAGAAACVKSMLHTGFYGAVDQNQAAHLISTPTHFQAAKVDEHHATVDNFIAVQARQDDPRPNSDQKKKKK